MESKKRQSEASMERAKVWWSFLSTVVAIIAALMSTLATVAEVSRLPEFVGGVAASFIASVMTAGFTAILARRERGTSQLAKLKEELTEAYLGALDRSPLNPARGGQR